MEKWEQDLRVELNGKIKEGLYTIGIKGQLASTDKQGYINYKVEVQRLLRANKAINCMGCGICKTKLGTLTKDKLDEFFLKIRTNNY